MFMSMRRLQPVLSKAINCRQTGFVRFSSTSEVHGGKVVPKLKNGVTAAALGGFVFFVYYYAIYKMKNMDELDKLIAEKEEEAKEK
eukprot:scaffold440_cov277-Ochromonas_danica.AAC.13